MKAKWVREFKNGRDNGEVYSGHPFLITDKFVASVKARIREMRHLTITGFSKVLRSLLYSIVSKNLHFRKLCSRRVPKLLTEDHKTKDLSVQ